MCQNESEDERWERLNKELMERNKVAYTCMARNITLEEYYEELYGDISIAKELGLLED